MALPGFGIGMINDDFHIAGIRQVVAERLKRVVMYSMVLGPRCFKWKMMSLSGPKALLFLQLLIAFITRSVVNVRTISNGFLFFFFFFFFFQEEDLFLYKSTKIFTEKREKTDISNTVRNIVEKQKQKAFKYIH